MIVLELQKKKLDFIWEFTIPKLRQVGESLQIDSVGNRSTLLMRISKVIMDPKNNLYNDVIDGLLQQHLKCDENNIET